MAIESLVAEKISFSMEKISDSISFGLFEKQLVNMSESVSMGIRVFIDLITKGP